MAVPLAWRLAGCHQPLVLMNTPSSAGFSKVPHPVFAGHQVLLESPLESPVVPALVAEQDVWFAV